MKTALQILLIISIFLTVNSCNKDKEANSILFSTWEAKSFMSLESVAYPKNENTTILLTFKKD
ncbi:MAG: hypothetical protein Q7J86_04390, partial [Bacteroidota bacterium]|nr:hypothetical protein [Bacteroidota bacterium]